MNSRRLGILAGAAAELCAYGRLTLDELNYASANVYRFACSSLGA